MSKPILYQEDNKNELQSAHTLAKRWNVSIRTARQKIKKLLKNGELKTWKH